MRTGWEFVVVGRDNPTKLLDEFELRPSHFEIRSSTETGDVYVVEFSDWRDGEYPLDLATEATDFIARHFHGLAQLCAMKNITGTALNFVSYSSEAVVLSADSIVELAKLGGAVSVCVLPSQCVV